MNFPLILFPSTLQFCTRTVNRTHHFLILDRSVEEEEKGEDASMQQPADDSQVTSMCSSVSRLSEDHLVRPLVACSWWLTLALYHPGVVVEQVRVEDLGLHLACTRFVIHHFGFCLYSADHSEANGATNVGPAGLDLPRYLKAGVILPSSTTIFFLLKRKAENSAAYHFSDKVTHAVYLGGEISVMLPSLMCNTNPVPNVRRFCLLLVKPL